MSKEQITVGSKNLSDEELVQKWLPVLKWTLIIGGVGILAGLGVLFWNNSNERHAEKAFSALSVADAIEERSLKEYADKKQDFLEIVTHWPDNKKAEYVEALEKVLRDFKDPTAVSSASLRLASFHMALKNYEAAEKAYRNALNTAKGKKVALFKALAFEGLGVCLETQSKNEEALKVYEDFSFLKDNPIEPLAHLGKARLQQILGKKEEALKSYDRVIKDFAGTQYERQARVLASLLKSGQS